MVAQARALMQHVAVKTGQSCHLAMINNAQVVVVAQVDAPVNMGFSVRLGADVELLNTASGHVILAFQNDAGRARALAEWKKRTGKVVPAGLARHLGAIRSRGYEELASYQVRGVVNISFPVLNQHGEAIAAMAVPFLARIGTGIGRRQVRKALASATRTLSASLGARKLELAPSSTSP
jgi:DNA-binding IclR family transcriptional regulator